MKILSIDTSSSIASVAIVEDFTPLITLDNADEKTHSQKLMPMIDEAFKKTGLSLNDIQLIACSLGPGSFTGVRIGIATAKAFVDSRNIPAVGVSSLEGLAYSTQQDGYICCLLNANHDNVYAGIFNMAHQNELFQTLESNYSFLNLKDDKSTLTGNSLISFIQQNIPASSPIYFVGDIVMLYKDLLQNLPISNKKNIITLQKPAVSSSISIAKAGYTKYKNGNYGNSSILSPLYLRKSQAELALDAKINSN